MNKNFVDAVFVKVGPTLHVQTGSQLGADEQGMQGKVGGPSTKKFRLPVNYFELVFTFLLTLATFVIIVGRSFQEDVFSWSKWARLAAENSDSNLVGSTNLGGTLFGTKWTGPKSIVLKALSAKT